MSADLTNTTPAMNEDGPAELPTPEYSEDGVDLSLLRTALRRTPLERLMQNDANKWVFYVARQGRHADR